MCPYVWRGDEIKVKSKKEKNVRRIETKDKKKNEITGTIGVGSDVQFSNSDLFLYPILLKYPLYPKDYTLIEARQRRKDFSFLLFLYSKMFCSLLLSFFFTFSKLCLQPTSISMMFYCFSWNLVLSVPSVFEFKLSFN